MKADVLFYCPAIPELTIFIINNDDCHFNPARYPSTLHMLWVGPLIIRLVLVYKIDNKMQALIQNNYRTKIQKEIIWLITMLLMILGLPLLKNVIVVILEKLYELFIQRAIEK